jgi:hypothetical protein
MLCGLQVRGDYSPLGISVLLGMVGHSNLHINRAQGSQSTNAIRTSDCLAFFGALELYRYCSRDPRML